MSLRFSSGWVMVGGGGCVMFGGVRIVGVCCVFTDQCSLLLLILLYDWSVIVIVLLLYCCC